MLLWTLFMTIEAVFSYFVFPYTPIVAFIIWSNIKNGGTMNKAFKKPEGSRALMYIV